MAPPKANAKTVSYRRTHNLLLASRLLNQRDTPSPFTLILDSLNQPSKPLVKEYMRRALISKIKIVYVAFECHNSPSDIDHFIFARRKSLSQLHKEITAQTSPTQKTLIIIDSLHHLCLLCQPSQHQQQQQHISSFLAPLLSPTTTLLATYHTDVPLPKNSRNAYTPEPLTLLKYLCTTLIAVHKPWQIFEQKRAIDRSLIAPHFGMKEEGIEGVLFSLRPDRYASTTTISESGGNLGVEGIIFELEHRRKSGRGVAEWYFLPPLPATTTTTTSTYTDNDIKIPTQYKERLMLLEDHPLYSPPIPTTASDADTSGLDGLEGDEAANVDDGLTFSLSLTNKQKMDREGIVLPYFDAQKEGGGMGGRILYVPGREDDWDDDEDEI